MTLNKALIYKILGALLGAILGYMYWFYVGCENGCTIRSVWWKMSTWGLLMGYLSVSIVIDYLNKEK